MKKNIEKIIMVVFSNDQILTNILQSSLHFLLSIIQRNQIFTFVNNLFYYVSSVRNGNQ